MKYSMNRFIRLACLTGVLLGAISTVQGQSRQIRLGDNMGDHMAAKDLDMNSKQILNAEGIAIGSATITNQNVAFQIDGTNKAILMPRITTLSAIASPVNGMLVYNSTDNKFYVRENGVWVTFATVTELNDKTSNIKVDNITIIKDNTGALAANVNSAIWNANRLQGNQVSATAPLSGQVLSWNGTAWVPTTATSATAQTVTAAAQPAITSVGTLTGLSVTNPIAGSVTGNAATATKLATPRNINGVPFDGSADITINAAADANTLTGTTLNPNVLTSSLTSVGTLSGLTVTNPIAGSITGNAATATALATARTINGVAFDGTANISIGSTSVPFTPAGSIAAGNVQAALVELDGDIALKAPLASPNLTGVPTAPTAAPGTNSTQLATTAFVTSAAMAGVPDADATTKGKIQLTGQLGGTSASPTITNAAVIAKTLTDYAAGAGTVSSADNILTAIQKLDGNDALKAPLASPTFTGTVTAPTFIGALTGNVTGDVSGNAATATALANPRTINGVAFDGTSNINITASAIADANSLTGTILAPGVVTSSLTSVGTLESLTVTAPISGSITGNAATATSATTAGTVTTAAQPAITSVGTLSGLTVTAPISGSVTGNAATATALANPRTINGVAFDGTSNINITASAEPPP
jgi:hypothetical protein